MKRIVYLVALTLPIQAGVLLSQDKPMPEGRTPAAAEPPKPVQEAATGWNQWRGPARTGQCSGPAWPERLGDSNLEKLWSVPLGKSYSGPVADAERIYTTESDDEKHELVRAFDRKTGEEIWKVRWKGHMKVPFFAARNGSWIRATPALDGDSLYVAGMADVLVCLDAKTGAERWRIDLRKDLKQPMQAFGFVCSPLVHGDHVYVQAGGGLLKIEKTTGKLVWTGLADRGGMMGGAFSSPVMATIQGKQQLLVQTRAELCGVDDASGDKLWGVPVKTFRAMNILTPLAVGNSVFTSAYGGRGHLFDVTQAGEDNEGAFEVRERWNNRAQGYMTSPVLIDGHAYIYLRSKRFACVEIESGEVTWISEPIGDEYASLVAQGDRILALTNSGALYLIQHNPESFEVIDRVEVASQETWAHLAVDGDQLLIRELEALTVYRWKR